MGQKCEWIRDAVDTRHLYAVAFPSERAATYFFRGYGRPSVDVMFTADVITPRHIVNLRSIHEIPVGRGEWRNTKHLPSSCKAYKSTLEYFVRFFLIFRDMVLLFMHSYT